MNFILLMFALCFFPYELMGISSMYGEEKVPRNIVFQPQFRWADGSCTQQGTGCLIRAPNGKIIGLTSAHFINFSGPKLFEVDWLDIRTKKPIASSFQSWGMPGREGSYEPLDLRSDYLLLLMEGNICTQSILEMDSRQMVEIGERVWFPNKNAKTHDGYELVEGTVSEATNRYLIIKLDKEVNLESTSGTPIISQFTKKVIGILTGGDKKGNNTLIYLAPGFSINKAVLEYQECFLLRNAIGQLFQAH